MSDWGYFPLAGPGGIAGMVGMLPMVVVWMAGWSGMNLRRTVVVVVAYRRQICLLAGRGRLAA